MFNLFQRNAAISTKDLAEKIKEPITLLDVRTPEEYRGGHITKAANYPLNKIDRYQGKEKFMSSANQGCAANKPLRF